MKHLPLAILPLMLLICPTITAQVRLTPIFDKLGLEARIDYDYQQKDDVIEDYGIHGKRFAMVLGGDIGAGFSYYLNQNIVATPGTSTLFDNTDFLYVNYTTGRLNLRIGKDALFIGAYEYDAAPIEVLFNSYYWDAIHCFQLGASASIGLGEKSKSGYSQTLAFQIANSPYIYSTTSDIANYGSEYLQGLFSYNLFWKGTFGHLNTLYSVNFHERKRGSFLNTIAIGNKMIYDRWDIYVDFTHHALSTSDWGKSYSIVSCANYKILDWLNLFGKIGYETNHSKEEITYAEYAAQQFGGELNCLERPETDHLFYGGGIEVYHPKNKDVKLHLFLRESEVTHPSLTTPETTETEKNIFVNVGLTWYMNIHKQIMQRFNSMN